MTDINVNTAFNSFLVNKVRLDSDRSDAAKVSHEWLIGQMHALHSRLDDFPEFYQPWTLRYGSFTRKTKTRELDDIDTMFVIPANGATYTGTGFSNSYSIILPYEHALSHLRNDYAQTINSIKVINQIKKSIVEIHQYRSSDTKRNGSAAILDLSSYEWNFDIVPAFKTSPEYDGRDFFLIPDGKGQWMKTDPRIDQSRLTEVNVKHNSRVIDVIRLFKQWADRKYGLSFPSHLAETLIINYYMFIPTQNSYYIDVQFSEVLNYISDKIRYDVADPKGIQSNINPLVWIERNRISNVIANEYIKTQAAIRAETSESDHAKSIRIWKEILGDDFAE